MKVIAKTGYGYMVEMNERELAHLQGHWNIDEIRQKKGIQYNKPDSLVGVELDVEGVYTTTNQIRDSAEKLKAIGESLASLSQTVMKKVPVLERAVTPKEKGGK